MASVYYNYQTPEVEMNSPSCSKIGLRAGLLDCGFARVSWRRSCDLGTGGVGEANRAEENENGLLFHASLGKLFNDF